MEGNQGSGREGWPADLPVHQVGEEEEIEGADPEVIEHMEGQLKPLNVIGGEVDHMAR